MAHSFWLTNHFFAASAAATFLSAAAAFAGVVFFAGVAVLAGVFLAGALAAFLAGAFFAAGTAAFFAAGAGVTGLTTGLTSWAATRRTGAGAGMLYLLSNATMVFCGVTSNSTRRFKARPSLLSLAARGASPPMPRSIRRSRCKPLRRKIAATACARSWLSLTLAGAAPE